MRCAKQEKNFGRKNLQLVLDANVYIFGLGLAKAPACKELILTIISNPELYNLRISRNIVEEVRNHLSWEDFHEFITILIALTRIDEDFLVPFELGVKYEEKGLKPPDALIAAYAEWTSADILVSENRHFLSRRADLPFKVFTAKACLKTLLK
jgi:predicted nucleic acid-binding protein